MNGNDNGFLDMIAILSVVLQISNYQNDLKSFSNDDLMKEILRQNVEYFERIIDNQNLILEKLAKLGW